MALFDLKVIHLRDTFLNYFINDFLLIFSLSSRLVF